MKESCRHEKFAAHVEVLRYEDEEGFMADIQIHCEQCRVAFCFLGLPKGLDLNGAAVSVGGETARLAIVPKDGRTLTTNPLLQGFLITRRQ